VTNAPANQTESSKLTQATYDRLVAELEDLTTRGRVEIAQAIEAARALGDLSENGDYHAAKDSQGKMESRIRQLQAMLKSVEIVDESGSGDGSISLGSTVTLRYEGDDEDDTQTFFVGSIEERQGDLPVVSPSSHLGQVLVGRSAGDAVEYRAPGGMLKVHIVNTER
jgi:transcription elongation factor GreA